MPSAEGMGVMPHDHYGRPLAPGDKVMIPATVLMVAQGGNGELCNVTVQLDHVMPGRQHRDQLGELNTKQVEKVTVKWVAETVIRVLGPLVDAPKDDTAAPSPDRSVNVVIEALDPKQFSDHAEHIATAVSRSLDPTVEAVRKAIDDESAQLSRRIPVPLPALDTKSIAQYSARVADEVRDRQAIAQLSSPVPASDCPTGRTTIHWRWQDIAGGICR